MSGIAGVCLLDGTPIEKKDLGQMKDSIAHRGPDGSGIWLEGSVGLIHQMLWTTPESLQENLPFEADGLVITSDARVDNREELLPELGLSGGVADSEVILRAYQKWGQRCVAHLLGDFAFAIWDKAKEELFCARDHMGIKPFYYYYEQGKIFVFGTEIKAVLAAPAVPSKINELRIGDYLIPIIEDKEITFYIDICRLVPAHIMIVSSDRLIKKQYWALDPTKNIRFDSDEEYAQAFREIFTEAVRCRLRSAFPVGSMLSGGLDSSSIVCVARNLLPKGNHLKTFSLIFDTVKECDEQPYINAVLAEGGLEPYFVHGDQMGPLDDIDKMLWHEDQPFFAPNLFMHWALYKKAHNQNVRVLLDGIDGDTTVSHGVARITELASGMHIISMTREIVGFSKNFNRPPHKVLLERAVFPFVPNPLRQFWRIVRYRRKDVLPNAKFLNPDFAARINLKNRFIELGQHGTALTSREEHWHRLCRDLISLTLDVSDMAAAANCIEPRNPFYDKRLVEFCLALPGDQKMRQGWTRLIMRHALEDILPKKVLLRGGKSNLSPNFWHGLIKIDHKLLKSVIFDNSKIIETYINTPEIQKICSNYISSNEVYEDANLITWNSVILAVWLMNLSNRQAYME